jgi:PrgI family protein
MRFQVPQFIEVEDKLFGPFTFKQFVYLAGGAGGIVALFTTLPTFLAFFLSIPIVALSLSLTFLKINNRPFIFMLESLFSYFLGEKLYIWKKEQKKVVKTEGEIARSSEIFIPKLSNSKLKDLSWSLDVTKNTAIDDAEDNIVSKS